MKLIITSVLMFLLLISIVDACGYATVNMISVHDVRNGQHIPRELSSTNVGILKTDMRKQIDMSCMTTSLGMVLDNIDINMTQDQLDDCANRHGLDGSGKLHLRSCANKLRLKFIHLPSSVSSLKKNDIVMYHALGYEYNESDNHGSVVHYITNTHIALKNPYCSYDIYTIGDFEKIYLGLGFRIKKKSVLVIDGKSYLQE